MPTIIRPHDKVVGKCTARVATRRDFYPNVSQEDKNRESIQTSVSDADAYTVVGCQNGFVHTVLEAWKKHLHLELRPDDVWLAVLVQFSFFINGDDRAEALRNRFVAHEGQQELIVELRSGTTVDNLPVAYLTECLVALVRDRLVDAKLADWLLPTFSTTLPNDRSIAAAVFLGTMKQYFTYAAGVSCGFPSVTLLGESSDWADLAKRVARLAEFDADTLDAEGSSISEWSRCLDVVLDWMVASFDRPDDDDVRDFWTRACHSASDGMSGGVVHMSGWLTAFCWWQADGTRQKAYSDQELADPWLEKDWQRLELSGVRFPVIDQEEVPTGLARVPITFYPEEVPVEGCKKELLMLLAGSSGTKLLDDQRTRVAPFSSWWLLRDKPGIENNIRTRQAVRPKTGRALNRPQPHAPPAVDKPREQRKRASLADVDRWLQSQQGVSQRRPLPPSNPKWSGGRQIAPVAKGAQEEEVRGVRD
ncbi:hypothetical protein LZ32DRAFT_604380 [Colletotrichum eremochloae]|nr:hypothetical protein LZ32DRAFT_604380 [Colletotrichum eremochloae]